MTAKKNIYILTMLIWLWAGSFFTVIPVHGQYIFNVLNREKGLPSDEVSSVMKDADGFIWAGTRNGLCRFDGSEIHLLRHNPSDSNSICDNDVTSILQDREGRIWVATGRGISTFMPGEKHFRHYFAKPGDSTSLTKNKVKYLLESRSGHIIIGTDAYGIDIYDPKSRTFTNHLPSEQITVEQPRFINTLICAGPDPGNSHLVWFGSQLGLLRFNILTSEWQHFPLLVQNASDPGLFTSRENIIRALLADDSGKLWLGTWGGGLCHFDPETGRFNIYKYESTEPVNGYRNNINGIGKKNSNELWILAMHKGVATFDMQRRKFHFISDPGTGNPPPISPGALLTDEEDFLWIASHSDGLFYSGIRSHQFGWLGIPGNMRDLAPDPERKDILYLSSYLPYGSLITLDTDREQYTKTDYRPVFDVNENHFMNILPMDGETWLVESYDLYRHDKEQGSIAHYEDFNPRLYTNPANAEVPYFISACTSPAGELWLGTKFNGIFRIEPAARTTIHYHFPDESGNIYFKDFIFCLFPDSRGHIWYGSTAFGYYDPSTQAFVNLSFSNDFPEAPVRTESIRSITETPGGHIWLGTENNGIMVIDPREARFVAAYTENNGLQGSLVKSMATDSRGHVWAVTDKALNHIDPESGSIRSYDENYGLSSLFRCKASPGGRLFISNSGGIYRFCPDSIRSYSGSARPYFRSFRIFDHDIDLGQAVKADRHIGLSPDENFFSIEYGARNFLKPEKTLFSYKLEGLDEQWINAGSRKYVSYTNLPGGSYVFRLRASAGGEHFEEITLPLHIGTPYYKTTWFYTVTVILFLFFLYSLHRYRMAQVKSQERMQTRYNKLISELEMKALRSQMNPHFLFNSLNSIRCYVLKEEFDNATGYITKFSKMLRLILHNSRQNLITLAEELETLRIYIEFEQMRYDNQFNYLENIAADVNPAGIMIQPMTMQPFVENAIWHGLMPKEGNKQLSLDIRLEGRVLIISIEDNGVGRKHPATNSNGSGIGEGKSYGLQITGERFAIMEKIRGKKSGYEITDLFDEEGKPCGTRVRIHYEI
jgi:ligand-binding sensor domain-containing protein